jgi:hypothetical protein
MSSPTTGLSLESFYLDSIIRLAKNMGSGQTEEEQVRYALDTAIGATGSSGGSVLLHDPARSDLRFVYSVTKREDVALPPLVQDLLSATIADNEGVAGRVFQSGKAEIVNVPRSDPDFARHVEERTRILIENLATVPIIIPGLPPLGVLQVINKHSGFTDDDVKTLSVIAAIVGVGLVVGASK